MKKSILGTIFVLFCCQWPSMAQTMEAFPLRAGAAKVDITPKDNLKAPATGKYDHERAYVRAIVLDNGATNAALISLEGVLDGPSWANVFKQLTIELNCPVENILISTTHAHSVNMNTNSSEPNGLIPFSATPQYLSSTVSSIVEAVHQAKAKLQPARMGFGRGMSYLNVNRDAIDPETRKWTQAANLEGWSDKNVDVIKFETPSGKPIAVYMNYGVHPVNGWVVGAFSADIPSAVSRYVEKAFNDEIIVAFSQGTQGDQNPLYLRPSTNAMASRTGMKITGYDMNREEAEGPLRVADGPGPADAKVLDNLFRFIESEGQILGEEVIRVMSVTKKMTGNVRIAGARKTVTCPGRIRTNGGMLDPANREGIEGVYKDGPDVNIQLGVLGIGTTAITFSAGEIYSYIGLRVKKESPLTNTMFVVLANGGTTGGYVPNDAAYGEQTFQVLNTRIKPGCAETSIVNTLDDMVTEYLTNNGKE